MGNNDIGGLLGLMTHMENEAPFYMVGQRALHSAGGDMAYEGSPSIGHEHFVRNGGSGNFGFTNTGVFSEPLSELEGYVPTSKYGLKKYDAGLLDLAHENWQAKNDAIDQIAEDMGLFEDGMPTTTYKDYSMLLNNCKDFVRWHDEEYDRLVRGKGQFSGNSSRRTLR